MADLKTICLCLILGFQLVSCNTDDSTKVMQGCDKDRNHYLDHTEFSCLLLQFDSNYNGEMSEAELEKGWHSKGLRYESHVPLFYLESDVTGDYKITSADMDYLMVIWDIDGNNQISQSELKTGWNAFYYDRFHGGK